jgi:hypothetical protein
MSENAEAEFGVFIEDLAFWHIITEVRGHKILILQDFTQQRAHLLPTGRARLALEDGVTCSGELLKGICHTYASHAMDVLEAISLHQDEPRYGTMQ